MTTMTIDPDDSQPAEPQRMCRRCGGTNGNHGKVRVRHGNGGGHNEACPNTPALPVLGAELRLHDGTTARVLRRYDEIDSRTMTGQDHAWQATGPQGARVISLDDIAGYTEDEQTAGASLVPVEIPGTDPDHVVARVLNAAINWENASQQATSMEALIQASDALHAAIRAYMPMVAK